MYFLRNADVSNRFAKFQCFDKKDDQQHVFFTQSKLWQNVFFTQLKLKILYKYSEKCVNGFPQE